MMLMGLMLRPKLAVKDFEKLLAVSNESFKNYGDMERRNLVAQFANQPEN